MSIRWSTCMTTKHPDPTAEHQAQIRKMLADHQIRSRTDRSWVVMRRDESGSWTGTMGFEVYVDHYGGVTVVGDLDAVRFACFSDSRDPVAHVRWMGECDDLGYYVRQKARIGMALGGRGSNELTDDLDERAFLFDAIDYVEREYAGGNLGKTDREVLLAGNVPASLGHLIPEWLERLLGAAENGDIEEVLAEEAAAADLEFFETGAYSRWGRVPSCRLIAAHEALRCLVRLLDAETATTSKPEELAHA